VRPKSVVCGIPLAGHCERYGANGLKNPGDIMRRLLKWVLILVVVAIALSAVAYPTMTWWQERNAPKYLTATVSRGRVETVVNSTGTLKAFRTVSVGAFTSGPIKEIYVDFNSEITQQDQVLALIDDKLQNAAVLRDKAAVETQEAEQDRVFALLEQAVNKEARAKNLKLVDPTYISVDEIEQVVYATKALRAQLKLAEASVKQAKANLQNSLDQLSYTKILGPKEIDPEKGIKGVVIDRKVDPGQTVAATFQTPELFTIALEMDKHLYVYASVDEADIGLIRAGTDRKEVVKFRVDTYPGELFDGTIHDIRLNSTTTQNVVTYPVIIDAPNREQKLKPGMTANITFAIEAKENVLRVPASALRFTPLPAQVHPDDRHHLEAITSGQAGSGASRTVTDKASMAQGRQRRVVWIQEGLLLRAVPVTLGLIENRYAELLTGDLREGQAVVTGTEGVLTPR
jgi:HlyD family secretion protein